MTGPWITLGQVGPRKIKTNKKHFRSAGKLEVGLEEYLQTYYLSLSPDQEQFCFDLIYVSDFKENFYLK